MKLLKFPLDRSATGSWECEQELPLKEWVIPEDEGGKRRKRGSLCFESRLGLLRTGWSQDTFLDTREQQPPPATVLIPSPSSSPLLWGWDLSWLTTGPAPAQLRRTHGNFGETRRQHTQRGDLALLLRRLPSPQPRGCFPGDLVNR